MRAVLVTFLLATLTTHVPAQERSLTEVSASLSRSANAFAYAWLVKRNVRKAMRYVAANPVLGKCNLPPRQTKLPVAPIPKRRTIQQTLESTLKTFPGYPDLKAALKPTEIPDADWFEATSTDLVQLLQIKSASEGSLICKLDESPQYLKSLQRPNVYYVGFRVTNPTNPELADWITAWRKESGRWRLIAIGLLED